MVSLSMGAERNEDGRRSEDCVDILPPWNGGDSYSSQAHACTRVASVGSCHDALAAGEGCEQANKANPGGTDTSRPPLRCVLYSKCRRNSNGLASRMERFSPDFWATRFPGFAFVPLFDALMFWTCKSSTNTTAWFLLMSFEGWCRKSFLMLAILLCNLVTCRLAFFQLLENFFLRAMRRCNLASLGRNFFNGCNCSRTSPLDMVMKLATPQSRPTVEVEGCCGCATSRSVVMLTNHLPADWLTVTLRTAPSTSRLLR